ncbi:MAG: class I SAM-dependent methyltransferase [Eubacteriales bacterium]|nr:class I SAM-dependent methyltransferase [Eubacteriales bacterium]
MVKLDSRLSRISGMCLPCVSFADIGSDHAKLPAALLSEGIIEKAFVTDIHEAPLENSRLTMEKEGLTGRCVFLCGDGLTVLGSNMPEGITICGMGGETVIKILSEGKKYAQTAEYLVLQPMTDKDLVYLYLNENGFAVTDEAIVQDGRLFYHILRARYTGKAPGSISRYDAMFSPILIEKRDPVMKAYLSFRLEIALTTADNIKRSTSVKLLDEINELISQIKERLESYEIRKDN